MKSYAELAGPDWRPDEIGLAGRENLDPVHVAHYDEKEDSGADAEVALLRASGVGPESVVVEYGPGTGQLTVALAPHCRRLVAVDVSAPMLEHLQHRLDRLGVTNVEPVHAGFLSYEHHGDPPDAVYSRFALHHLPDFWKVVALQRIRQLLRPGGLLRLCDVVFAFEPSAAEQEMEAWCAAYGEAGLSTWGRADIAEHVRDEHSTFTWLLEPMIEHSGFIIESADHDPDHHVASYLLRVRG